MEFKDARHDVISAESHTYPEEDDRSWGSASKRLKSETVLVGRHLDDAVAHVSNPASLAALLFLESLAKDSDNIHKMHFKLEDQLQIQLILAKRLVKVFEQEILEQRGLKTIRPSTRRH